MNFIDGDGYIEAKERILRASSRLFSEKGYDAARVSEIAHEAGVNKALIYYYFKNKEDILNTLLSSLNDDLQSFTLEYISKTIVKACDDGKLRITHDRLSFSDEAALNLFMEETDKYYFTLIDYMLEREELFRILMIESLNRGRNSVSITNIFKMASYCKNDPLYKNIYAAVSERKDYSGAGDIVPYYFFLVFLPAINFVCYFSEYTSLLGKDETSLKQSFVRALGRMLPLRLEDFDIIKD
jgi:AcrR family transcriptional regulator